MNLKTIFLFFVLLVTVYQDFPLINKFGEIARSPVIFFTPLMLIYIFQKSTINISKYTKYFFLYVLFLIMITIVHVIWIVVTKREVTILGENIFIKSIKMATYPLIALIYYQFIYTFLNKNETRFEMLFNAAFALKFFLIIYLIFEVYYSKTLEAFMPFLHSSDKKYWRVRLLTMEESWVGSVLTIISFITVYLSIYLNKSRKVKLIVYSMSIFFILYYTIQSESKGYMLIFLIATLPLMIKYFYENKKMRKFLIAGGIVIFVVGVYVFFSLEHFINSQFHSSVTFGTRFSSYLAAIKNFFNHPFGVGWGPYLHYYINSLNEVIKSSTMSSFNLIEVKKYLETSNSLSTKTYFFDNLIYGGISFLLFFYYFFIKRYFFFSKQSYSSLSFIKIPLLYIVLSSLLYVTFAIKYEVWFFLAFLDVLESKIKIGSNNSFQIIDNQSVEG